MSKNGVARLTSPKDTPGRLTVWQKYCVVLILSNVNKNFVDCNRFVFSGLLFIAVILSPLSVFRSQKKDHPKVVFKMSLCGDSYLT
jgi:hypothetical protein